MNGWRSAATLAGMVALGAAGCAGNRPAPSASIDQAEQRIEEAERAEAQRYANRELNLAREKLIQAREAQEEGDEERAARLAERAELDAAYAAAVADSEEVQTALQEVRETLATLESELGRTGDQQEVDVAVGEDIEVPSGGGETNREDGRP